MVSIKEIDIIASIKEHLERKGYSVQNKENNRLSIEFRAERKRETFIIEGIWETNRPPEENITYALGKIVKRMEEDNPWTDYGIAMPKSYFKALRNFQTAGFKNLKLHLFLVEGYLLLTHLDTKLVVELIEHLKAGNVESLHIWGINYE